MVFTTVMATLPQAQWMTHGSVPYLQVPVALFKSSHLQGLDVCILQNLLLEHKSLPVSIFGTPFIHAIILSRCV